MNAFFAHAGLFMGLAVVTATVAPIVAWAAPPYPVPPREERGREGADCRSPEPGPAVRLTVKGLKDREGRLQVELYPANDSDFLAADKKLIAEGKPFKRVRYNMPASGDPVVCIRAPEAGRYAIVVLHDRDRNGKFGYLRDGVAFPNDPDIVRSKPKASAASVQIGSGTVVRETVTMQYLRGLQFGPVG
ncbi:DUF2141 domain-containing protein [Croceicoccus sp. Ery5]|uniref:DUF2141 domain-containing protein n=1 Tax=Croceicoccus sp. Ery5 TaxID=1703340 RepID=UPI001E5F6559|nr:DUF2141 domain-containing protein [Croceicoccus sp. Ery5]